MINIFNISEVHYYKQSAQKNIRNLFDNNFFDTLLRKTKKFIGWVYIANVTKGP